MRATLVFAPILMGSMLLTAGCMTFNVSEGIWLNSGYAAMAPKAQKQLTDGTGYALQSVFFDGADGTHLHGLLLTKPGNRVTILYFGGAGFQTGLGGFEIAKTVEQDGVDALLVDYRGYGESEGKATVAMLESDSLAAYDFLSRQPAVAGTAIVVHGFSMGSMVAPYVAANRPVSGLVLESTATNPQDWANNGVPWYAWPFVTVKVEKSLQQVSNIALLEQYRGPLFLVVGDDDPITPPRFSQRLYEISATPAGEKLLVIAKGRTHGDALEDDGARDQYRKFIDGLAPAAR